MTKRELIEEISHLNLTASPAFLARFEDADLAEYLRHLQWLGQPRQPLRVSRPAEPSAGPVASAVETPAPPAVVAPPEAEPAGPAVLTASDPPASCQTSLADLAGTFVPETDDEPADQPEDQAEDDPPAEIAEADGPADDAFAETVGVAADDADSDSAPLPLAAQGSLDEQQTWLF